jgi:uncharacterized membrane-anchored protein YhcB (DUF1043 family)
MALELGNWELIALGGALFASGLVVGLLISYAGDRVRARVRVLERELADQREQNAAYQDAVGKHFGQTSDLFRDLTHQYTSLYAHLAEGARELCADRIPALGRGFGLPGLEADVSEESRETVAEEVAEAPTTASDTEEPEEDDPRQTSPPEWGEPQSGSG